MAEKQYYLTWDESDTKSKQKALDESSRAIAKYNQVLKATGSDIYLNIGPANTSIKDSFSRSDYEAFRAGERIPKQIKDVMRACMNARDEFGIIDNAISLMSDFTIGGIDIVHRNERIEQFYKQWFKKVEGRERSSAFTDILYSTGNVIVKRSTAKLKVKDEENLKKAQAEADLEIKPEEFVKREIPWQYTFLNPLSVELISDSLAPFLGPQGYLFGIRIPEEISRIVKRPKDTERSLVDMLPKDIVTAIRAGRKIIELPQNKVSAYYYRKRDWQGWARPMIAPILPDLQILYKMKLSDLAALDGAISNIRVWKLGSLADKILPSEAAIQRLAEILANNVGGGVMDLVWGPELTLEKTETNVHQYLGDVKYRPVLEFIYQGIGFPQALNSGGQKSGMTNNALSLRTLIERLNYGRAVLKAFWENEIRLVQLAMGFRFPAEIIFDFATLSDEAAIKQLLLNAWDRDIVSIEFLQEKLGAVPEIEQMRIKREKRRIEQGQIPHKASPFHDPMKDYGLAKIMAQSGAYTPSELGLNLKDKKPGEKSPAEVQSKLAPKLAPGAVLPSSKKKGQPGQGRPKNKKDSQKRKQKVVKPRQAKAFLKTLAYAEELRSNISEIVTPIYLKSLGKKNLRQLTDDETKDFENFQTALLFQYKPESIVDEQVIRETIKGEISIPSLPNRIITAAIQKYQLDNNKEVPIDVARRFQAGAYAIYYGDEEESSDFDDDSSEISRIEEESTEDS